MFDSRIVTSPCAGVRELKDFSVAQFTTKFPLETGLSGVCRIGCAPENIPPSGAHAPLLAVDGLLLVFRGEFSRKIDRSGKLAATFNGVRLAGYRIFENRSLEDILLRQLAASRGRDRPLHRQADIVV